MSTPMPQALEALSALLADLRASVECEIALASGATEHQEREAFTAMGREDIEACCALRERLARLAPGTPFPQVSEAAYAVLGAEHHDDRLRAFATHQRAVLGQAEALQTQAPTGELDRETRQHLQRIAETHVWHGLWAEQRASEFAATRVWDFKRPGATATASPAPRDTSIVPLLLPETRAVMVVRADGGSQEMAPGLEPGGLAAEPAPERQRGVPARMPPADSARASADGAREVAE